MVLLSHFRNFREESPPNELGRYFNWLLDSSSLSSDLRPPIDSGSDSKLL